MPYGTITTYGQSPQIDSPLQHTGALVSQHMGSSTTVYGSESPNTVTSTALQTTSQAASATTSLFRNEDKRLTREAMEKYLRNRNDMIIIILHAKVITCLSSYGTEGSHLLFFRTLSIFL
jgi:RNase P protein component